MPHMTTTEWPTAGKKTECKTTLFGSVQALSKVSCALAYFNILYLVALVFWRKRGRYLRVLGYLMMAFENILPGASEGLHRPDGRCPGRAAACQIHLIGLLTRQWNHTGREFL
jgi:hypothetical protein